MKHDWETPNLKDAYPSMPENCREALLYAVRSVKEEAKPVKRISLRMAVIAAALIILVIAAAMAASQMGLIDFFSRFYNVTLPDTAREELADTEQRVYTVGPLLFTLRETLADGRIAYTVTHVAAADDSAALITMFPDELIPDSEADRLNIPAGMNYMEAAQQTHLPLYFVTTFLDISEAQSAGVEMRDYLPDGAGGTMLVDMVMTNPDTITGSLEGTLTFIAFETDPETGESIEDRKWRTDEAVAIAVHGVIDEKTYTPYGNARAEGYTFDHVQAIRTSAGIYLITALTADPGTSRTAVYETGYTLAKYLDTQGHPFPIGISLSGSLYEEDWPTVTVETMISMASFPEELLTVYTKDGEPIRLR